MKFITMNIHSDSVVSKDMLQPATVDGYVHLASTTTMFEMDLIGKNLVMNGIDALWFYPDSIDLPNELSSLFVRIEQKENALSVLSSLDLLDFTTHHGK